MIYIDLPGDLNLEDEGRNVARLADAVTPDAVTPGAVLVAGAPRAWSWAVVESVDSGFVYALLCQVALISCRLGHWCWPQGVFRGRVGRWALCVSPC